MNTSLKLLLGCGLTLTGWAQGQIDVANRDPALGIDAPVFDVDCTTRLERAAYAAQAYAGLEPDSLAPYSPILRFRTGAYAGYITSTVVTFPPEMTFRWCISNCAPGKSRRVRALKRQPPVGVNMASPTWY